MIGQVGTLVSLHALLLVDAFCQEGTQRLGLAGMGLGQHHDGSDPLLEVREGRDRLCAVGPQRNRPGNAAVGGVTGGVGVVCGATAEQQPEHHGGLMGVGWRGV